MIKQFIADAFTDKIFHGNPAAICLPERWPDDKLMQDIASENNLSETAFVVKEDSGWKLRWFYAGRRNRFVRARNTGYCIRANELCRA